MLHWSGDAGGWCRGLKHSKFGFKQVENGRVTAQSPSNMKTCLLFEGKDNWANYKELLAPFLPVMDELAEEGMTVEDTKYAVKQTFGADYLLLAEVMGHSGASATNGCCLCDEHKDNYGRVVTDSTGRRVPLKANDRTTASMAAAAHRPRTTGPDVECPYCQEKFPDEEAAKASVPPADEAERRAYQLKHRGMRFGTPPLFNFEVTALVLCILHTLLGLVAITFQRTILVNLDTQEKVDVVNEVISNLHLGCKKLELRKTSGERRQGTNA